MATSRRSASGTTRPDPSKRSGRLASGASCGHRRIARWARAPAGGRLTRRRPPRIEIAPMTFSPTPDWLLEEAKAIASELRKTQDETDARGYYSDAIHERLLKGGFYRILQPRKFGGLGTDCETYIRVIMTLSQGHPAAGWCYTLASSHALILGSCFSEEAQRELFGADGDFRAAYAAGPAGVPKFERREGGHVVSGLWPFASGIPVSNHLLGGAVIPDETGAMRAI